MKTRAYTPIEEQSTGKPPCLQDPHQGPWQPDLWEKQDGLISKGTEVTHQDLGSCTSYWYHTMGI